MKRPKAYEYVNRYYGLRVKPGMRVTTMDGKKTGTVVRKYCYDHYVHVKFDGTKFDVPCHPQELVYDSSIDAELAKEQNH